MLNNVRPINKSFCLQTLCEENYLKLSRLIPSFEQPSTQHALVTYSLLDKGPFTYTVLLQPILPNGESPAPCFKCRVYLDTKAVEVILIEDSAHLLLTQNASPQEVLNHKWSLNYFFEKWLTFQLSLANVEQTSRNAINA